MFTVPKLPYETDALEPYLSRDTVHIHYEKHTKKYFDVTNQLIKGTIFDDYDELKELITNKNLKKDTKLYTNSMQAYNHSLYWENLSPKKKLNKPSKNLMQAIKQQWEDFETFKAEFSEAGIGGIGSTWCWLVLNKKKLEIVVTNNADNPVYSKQGTVLLVVDGWEHAWYLSYMSNKAVYFHITWEIINWSVVNKRYQNT